MALGVNREGSSSTTKTSSMNPSRSSIDSGYHSMIAKPAYGDQDSDGQLTTFVTSGTETSPERSPRKLHKAISSRFSGAMQAFSNTVRATTSYIYPATGEPELPSNEWAECETPKKESRRSSIMSSVRSRKQKRTPRASGPQVESPEMQPSPVAVTQDRSPMLDVKIPNASLSHESLGIVSVTNGSQLLAGVKLPGPKNLWPGPTRLTVEQASGNNNRGETPRDLVPKIVDPYVEQGDRLQQHDHAITSSKVDLELTPPESNKRYMSDDKGYLSEAESNDQASEADGSSPACLNHMAQGSPDARQSSACCLDDPAAPRVRVALSASPSERTLSSGTFPIPPGSESLRLGVLDSAAEKTASLEPANRRFSRQNSSLEDRFKALSDQHEPAITSRSRSLKKRLSSDVYDADAETLESSMGSRSAWERHRADRERRYLQIVDMAPDTESDEELGAELGLKRSPSKKPVHSAEELVSGTANAGRSRSAQSYPTGDLRYAVEAIERAAFPLDDLAYAVEAIDRPSVSTLDSLETIFQQRPMLRLRDTVNEPETLKGSDLLDSSPSYMEASSSPTTNLSASRVRFPSSSESSLVGLPPAPMSSTTTLLTDEGLMDFGAGNLNGQSIYQQSSVSTDAAAKPSPQNQSRTASEDAYEAGPKPGGRAVLTYLSGSSKTGLVGDDACETGVRASNTSMPTCSPDIVQRTPVSYNLTEDEFQACFDFFPVFKETSHSTYRGQLEAASTLTAQGSRTSIPFGHSRTVSALSDNTDDSCAITTHSPSCNAPPPFPSLHVRSEPARRISNALDALASHGDEEIRISGPANAGISRIGPSLPSPTDGPGRQTDEAGPRSLSLTTSEGASSPKNRAQSKSLTQHDLRTPSPCNMSSMYSRSNSNTPQETFDAAKLPSLGSPSPVTSRSARRKQEKSSSSIGNYPLGNWTISGTSQTLEPDSSPPRLKPNKNSVLSGTQASPVRSVRIPRGNVQKPSPACQISKKNRDSRDQASLADFDENTGSPVTSPDLNPKFRTSKKSPCGKGKICSTLMSSPPHMKLSQARGERSSDDVRENAERAIKDFMSRHEPKFSIEHFTSTSNVFSSHDCGKSDGTSYAGHQLDTVLQEISPGQRRDDDLQQDNDQKTANHAGGGEVIGEDSDSDKDASHARVRNKNGKPLPEAEKKIGVQRELQRKSDHACNRLVSKLKNNALGDDHACEDDPAHKDGRPHWRP